MNDKVYAAAADGALLSRDLGEQWQYIYRPHTLHDIANDGVYVYAMTLGAGLLRSADDGESWENVNAGLPAIDAFYTFQVQHVDGAALAAHWDGLYRAPDRAASWTRLTDGLPPTASYLSLAVTPHGVLAGRRP